MPLPIIRKTQTVAQSRFFKIEEMHNIQQDMSSASTSGCLRSGGVIVVAVNANDELLLIRGTLRVSASFSSPCPRVLQSQGRV